MGATSTPSILRKNSIAHCSCWQMRMRKMQFAQWQCAPTWLQPSVTGAVHSKTAQCTSTDDNNTVKLRHNKLTFTTVMPSLYAIFVISKQYSSHTDISEGHLRVTSLHPHNSLYPCLLCRILTVVEVKHDAHVSAFCATCMLHLALQHTIIACILQPHKEQIFNSKEAKERILSEEQ